MSVLLALLLLQAVQQPTQTYVEYALPVGPGLPGGGPWRVKLWTRDNCKACTVPEADRRTFAAIRNALVSKDEAAVARYSVPVTVVSFNPGQSQTSTNLAALRKSLGACTIGAEAPLTPNRSADPATLFGLGLDCPGSVRRRYLSLTIASGAIKTAYYLPDELIKVLIRPT